MGIFSFFNFFKKKEKAETAEDIDYSTLGLKSPDLATREEMREVPKPPPSALERAREDLPPFPSPDQPRHPVTQQSVAEDNVRAKMDLMMTHIDSIRIQSEATSERLEQVEKMVKRILEIAKSRSPF